MTDNAQNQKEARAKNTTVRNKYNEYDKQMQNKTSLSAENSIPQSYKSVIR